MGKLLSLNDRSALDAAAVGRKAAGLARARRAGLPVLPGWIVPAEAAASAARAGIDALVRSSAAARLAIARLPLESALERDLDAAADALGPALIVRSSTDRDDDPRWAGAFATYTDVSRQDLPVAVRGCWASAFAPDALGRAGAAGVPASEVRVSVLLQPWVPFDAGGTAEVGGDGTARLHAALGRPERLLSGRVGGEVVDVPLGGGPVETGVPAGALRRAADLARRTHEALGAPMIEWGIRGADLWLLQARPRVRMPVGEADARAPARPYPPVAERLAELAARFPAPLGDIFVMPWAASSAVAEVPPSSVRDLDAALDEAIALADELTARAWGMPVHRARARAATAIREVLGPDPRSALASLSRLRPVDPAAAGRLIGLVRGMGRTLARRSAIPDEDLIWRLSPGEVRAAERGTVVGARGGPGRWEPFLASVASANGRGWEGVSAAPGIGAGRVVHLRPPGIRWPRGGREVLVVSEPVPAIAPLLWGAAGLVAGRGSGAAHVFEVARSLGVPAVVGVDVPVDADGAIGAVDGTAGAVFVLPRGEATRARAEVAG